MDSSEIVNRAGLEATIQIIKTKNELMNKYGFNDLPIEMSTKIEHAILKSFNQATQFTGEYYAKLNKALFEEAINGELNKLNELMRKYQ